MREEDKKKKKPAFNPLWFKDPEERKWRIPVLVALAVVIVLASLVGG